MKLVYLDPLGGRKEDVDFQTLRSLLLTEHETYWNSPSDTGFATLDCYADNDEKHAKSALVFTMKNDFGYHISFIEKPGSPGGKPFYAIGGTDYDDLTWVNYSGEEMRLPRALFLSPDNALEVIRHFFDTGERSDRVQWRNANDVPWKLFEAYR